MGLDLAAVNSGLSVVKAHYPKYSVSCVYEEALLHPKNDFRNRIKAADGILNTALAHSPDVIVIEDYARRFGHTNTSGFEHGEIGGMVRKVLHQADFLIYVIPPTTMRSFMDIKPKSGKDALVQAAETRLGYVSSASNKKDRSNITDAFLHAHIGALTFLLKNHKVTYDFSEPERRILFGDKQVTGLIDRSTIEYGKEAGTADL